MEVPGHGACIPCCGRAEGVEEGTHSASRKKVLVTSRLCGIRPCVCRLNLAGAVSDHLPVISLYVVVHSCPALACWRRTAG
ncbi:hypothetical protein E2C01_044327 [Portunus trituberculatus]|uniref:Uncharacterized protein n=1 Tax=Portunus trituberculatus TaxID=210409 RepID=A0A5B7G050_PORTR|nr:hypothetical protein [Portunus trituberculatus]